MKYTHFERVPTTGFFRNADPKLERHEGCPGYGCVKACHWVPACDQLEIGTETIPYDKDFSALSQAMNAQQSGTAIDIVLPSETVLIRHSHLPSSTRSRLDQIVGLDLSRSTPLDAKTVEMAHNILGKKDDQITVESYVIRKSTLAQLDDLAEKSFVKIRRVLVRIDGRSLSEPLIDRNSSLIRQQSGWIAINLLLFGMILGLVGWTLSSPYRNATERLRTVNALLDAAREEAFLESGRRRMPHAHNATERAARA